MESSGLQTRAGISELEMAGAKPARIGTFCIYEARDGAAIGEPARRVGMPGTVLVRPGPAELIPA